MNVTRSEARIVHWLVIALLLAAPLSMRAATLYSFRVVSEGEYPVEQSGRVVMDAERWRVDLDEVPETPRAFDAVIGVDGERLAVNHQNETWYELEAEPVIGMRSLLDLLRRSHATAHNVRVSMLDHGGGTQSLAFRYDARMSVLSETVRATVSGTFTLTRRSGTSSHQPILVLARPETGVPELDEKIRELLSLPGGTISRIDTTIERTFRGGKPMRQSVRVMLDEAAEPAGVFQFDVPAGYAHRAPVIGAPGR